MLFNPIRAYHNELVNVFITHLIEDKESKFYKKTKLEVLESLVNNNISFNITNDEVIQEVTYKSNRKQANEIFTKDHKNTKAIDCLKILLKEELIE